MGWTSTSFTFARSTKVRCRCIVTHGWPGSIIEQMKIIDPLTNPTAHGGSASDAFHVVIPSMPGYGYLGQADQHRLGRPPHRARLGRADEAPGIHAIRGARRRLGWARHRSDGRAGAAGLLGIHTNLPGVVPADDRPGGFAGAPAPAGLSAEEKRVLRATAVCLQKGVAYGYQMGPRPQTLYRHCGFSRRARRLFPATTTRAATR